MVFVPFTDCVEVVFNQVIAEQEVKNVLGFATSGTLSIATMNALAAALVTWWEGAMSTYQSDDLSLLSLTVRDLTSVSAPSIEYVTGLPFESLVHTPAVPNNAALVTTFLTDLRGRSFRGRAYICGLHQSNLADSAHWSDSVTIAQNGAFAGLPTSLPSGWEHVVLSRVSGGAPRVTGVSTVITGYRTNTAVDSQERRLAGRGR